MTSSIRARRLFVAAVLVSLAFARVSTAPPDDQYQRIARLERWLKDIARHQPGTPDDAVVDAAGWSNTELELLRIDSWVLSRLMRNPRLNSFVMPPKEVECIDCFAARRDVTQARMLVAGQTIRYTDAQLHRVKVLACAASGRLQDAYCRQLEAEREIDEELKQLSWRAAADRQKGDDNYVLRRGALLHGDVGMVTSGTLRPMTTSPSGGSPVRVHMVDGEATDIGIGDGHWTIGRSLLDEVKPGRDAMVRLWYVATSTWMQRDQQYNPAHIAYARGLFPDDATILFLSGTHAESYAGAGIQAVLKTAVLPTGYVLRIGSSDAEMKSAETFLERAVRIDPSSDEPHLHLGHVLLARGKPQEAVAELQRAASGSKDPLILYYAAMFLGSAEEELSQYDAAREAYEKAATVFPRAQSPHLALSALNARRGNRTAAIGTIAPLFALPSDVEYRDDPWWRYSVLQGRPAGDLLEQLWAQFRR
ncbi:MAG TPA: tetratricopeptide repeat protein [Vicinamibacterales bacterium]|nr:tetratricopeptide repeat protein [Vicinamibacterales bacterium]